MDKKSQDIRNIVLECLERWVPFSEQYWHAPPSRSDLGCFGSGYNNWGVQTNQKYLAAMGVLAAAGKSPEGLLPEKVLERFLASLRFSLESHLTGGHHCTDGTKWGHTWISALGIERMMHAVNLMDDLLSQDDRTAVESLIVDEANHQLEAEVLADLWGATHRNKPEANIWNGAICARAALRYPEHPNRDKWLEKANLFWLNGISVPADAEDNTRIADKPLRQWHLGANFFPNFALDHHAYLNVGYIVICLSNIAMIHYAFVLRNCEPPETLYHHARDLWGLVRRLIFRDGRLIRIGGDTRIRYCYCQDYVLPTLVFAADHWQDAHALDLLKGAVDLMRQEQEEAKGGRFLSERCAEIERENPYYYTRLEADKAAALSMVVHWLEQRSPVAPDPECDFETAVAGNWEEPEHGAVFHRSPTRFASWSWRAAESPQGLCLPPSDGHLAEWSENLGGGLTPVGDGKPRVVSNYSIESFEGGFLTSGTVEDAPGVYIPEGWNAETTASHFLVYAALPDGHTAVRIEYAVTAPRRVYLKSYEGVKLEIPNDVFNGRHRRYYCATGQVDLASHLGVEEIVDLESQWVNVENVLGLIGIYGAKTWSILRRGRRIGGSAFGNILTDTLCYGLGRRTTDIHRSCAFLDNATAVLSSVTAEQTREFQIERNVGRLEISGDSRDARNLRAVFVRGVNGRRYLLAANPAASESKATLSAPEGKWLDLVSDKCVDSVGSVCVVIPPEGAVLLAEQQD